MSTALAVAATTRVLGSIIDNTIQAANVSGVLGMAPFVTSQAPDQLEVGATEKAQLGLFLYHVTHNQGWREMGLPSTNSAGAVIDRPPLAVDLHYLLIAYGAEDYIAQLLLGLGMQALHETPVLFRQQIVDVFTPPTPPSPVDTLLATAGIDQQVELIKVVPEMLSTDDLSKLWTALGSKFRPSAGYVATTVLIQSTAPVSAAPPVASRNLLVMQLRQPTVDTITPLQLPWSANSSLTLSGSNLAGPGVMVVFDNDPGAPQSPLRVDALSATVDVPTLPAGINPLRVVQQVAVGAPPVKNVVQSNVAIFYLQPVIRPAPAPAVGEYLVTPGATDTSVTPNVTPVTVQLDPVLGSTQQVQLLLNELNPPGAAAPLSFTFTATPAQIGVNSVTFSTSGTRAGDYLVRVRVDGAESPLYVDGTGAYAKPTVTL